MPGPAVHLRHTMTWSVEEGLSHADAETVASADILVDTLWPGSRTWWRHFNPPASLVFGPLELRRAVLAERAGDHAVALTHLGRSLHSRQDAVGHGRLGLNHLMWDVGLLKRNPDDWDLMPTAVQARIERATRRAVRAFVARSRRAEGA
jgi:hypothetical protein